MESGVVNFRPEDTPLVAWILVAHIFGIVLWVGGLIATTVAMSRQTAATSADASLALSAIQRRLLRAMADPGAAFAILAGIGLIFTNLTGTLL